MKSTPFEYHAPTTVGEAISLLAEFGDDGKALAGGQSLIPILAMRLGRFGHLVDLRRVEGLRRWHRYPGGFEVGAMVREFEIESDPQIASMVPLMSRATPLIGHFQIRSLGTLGGCIAHADPAAEYPAAVLALEADILVAGTAGARIIPAKSFFLGNWVTALASDELVTGVRFPSWGPRTGWAVEEIARRSGDYAIAGATCGVELEGTTVRKATVAVFGVHPTPLRLPELEVQLAGSDNREIALEEMARLAASLVDPGSDVHASADFRRHLTGVVVKRVLTRALEEATCKN